MFYVSLGGGLRLFLFFLSPIARMLIYMFFTFIQRFVLYGVVNVLQVLHVAAANGGISGLSAPLPALPSVHQQQD